MFVLSTLSPAKFAVEIINLMADVINLYCQTNQNQNCKECNYDYQSTLVKVSSSGFIFVLL